MGFTLEDYLLGSAGIVLSGVLIQGLRCLFHKDEKFVSLSEFVGLSIYSMSWPVIGIAAFGIRAYSLLTGNKMTLALSVGITKVENKKHD
jgi:hypothetical protein